MKRIISFLCIFTLLICLFSSCKTQETETYPITVNGTPINSEIFRYYLDEVWDSQEAQGSKDGRITQATYKCIRYVAVNSTFAAYSLSLSDAEKAELSAETNVLWNMFGEYYKSIGVSKETYHKVRTSQEYIEKLRLHFFDKGGTDEISDGVLRGIMVDNFTAFRYVRTPVMNTDVYGNTVDYTQEERTKLNTLYSNAVNTVAVSYTVEKAYNEISAAFPLTEQSYENIVIGRNDHEFSSVFFDKVNSMEDNTASVFQYNDYVYLVFKVNMLTDGLIFSELRSECLKIVSEEPLQSKINMMCNAYQSVRDTSVVREDFERVAKNR